MAGTETFRLREVSLQRDHRRTTDPAAAPTAEGQGLPLPLR